MIFFSDPEKVRERAFSIIIFVNADAKEMTYSPLGEKRAGCKSNVPQNWIPKCDHAALPAFIPAKNVLRFHDS